AWLELLGEKPLDATSPRPIVLNPSERPQESGVHAYEYLVKQIESAAAMDDGSLALNEVVVLVDSVRPSQLNPLVEGCHWEGLLAMLILTFPEIRWHFGAILDQPLDFPAEDHNLVALLSKARRDPLFDATGLRNFVKRNIAKTPNIHHPLPDRLWAACAIDEEKAFAYFHAYTAYRYNFRTDVVTSRALMADRFINPTPHGYWLLLEDMNLNFPDRRDDDEGLSDLKTRGAKFKALAGLNEDSTLRALITTGDMGNLDRERTNRSCLRESKPAQHEMLHKPTDGMMGLWKQLKLDKILGSTAWNGYAHGYCLPCAGSASEGGTGHSAPGKLTLIAETLYRRAEVFRDDARTVKDFIKGAVLANDAFELLGAKTPMLSLTCLKLKHEYEVRAECAFFGTPAEFEVQPRCEEILTFVRHVCSSIPVPMGQIGKRRSRRAASIQDAYAAILNRLVIAYRDAGQFHEEHECLIHQKRALRELKRLQPHAEDRPLLDVVFVPMRWVASWIETYSEYLLESFPRFVGIVAAWISAGVFILWALAESSATDAGELAKSSSENASEYLDAFGSTVDAFVGGGVMEAGSAWWMILISGLLAMIGFFHLGVFISFLYTKSSRK
ncbi:MAG: hypothetical protein KDK97_16870, partial [Verrucomicrobiales bacterium]|nr:hypothetical protein [Verrucomicrobiales bacterium]